MKSLLFFFLSLVPTAQANDKLNLKVIENYKDRNVLKQLGPKDMGTLHNTIMSRVHDRILNKMPGNQDIYSAIMIEEVSAICDDNDNNCKESVHDLTLQSKHDVIELFDSGRSFDVRSIIPEDFDQDLANNYESIYNSLFTLDTHGLDAYQDELDEILNVVEGSDLPEHKVQLLQEIISIAKSSGEFWTEFINNSDSTLHTNQEGRNLQTNVTITFNVFDTTRADVVGGLRASIQIILGSPLLLFNVAGWTTELLPDVFRGALVASLFAMGIIIQIPSTSDIISCAAAVALDEQGIDLEENAIVGDIVGDLLIPCNSTTLFGPFLGPIVASLLPEVFDYLDNQKDETDPGN